MARNEFNSQNAGPEDDTLSDGHCELVSSLPAADTGGGGGGNGIQWGYTYPPAQEKPEEQRDKFLLNVCRDRSLCGRTNVFSNIVTVNRVMKFS